MFHLLSYLIMLSLFMVLLCLKSDTVRRWIGRLFRWYYLESSSKVPDLAGRLSQRKLLFSWFQLKPDLL